MVHTWYTYGTSARDWTEWRCGAALHTVRVRTVGSMHLACHLHGAMQDCALFGPHSVDRRIPRIEHSSVTCCLMRGGAEGHGMGSVWCLGSWDGVGLVLWAMGCDAAL
eukprot:360113-Chlamydomonas_euryale.AAC.5